MNLLELSESEIKDFKKKLIKEGTIFENIKIKKIKINQKIIKLWFRDEFLILQKSKNSQNFFKLNFITIYVHLEIICDIIF